MARTRPKSGITTSATKGPLRDITDRYNPLCSTQYSVNHSTPDPRRKPNPLALTSLPPSSPPSTSSRPFIVHAQLVSPFVPLENIESGPDDPRFNTTAAADAHSDADPFGFFALENKLKIFRRNQQSAKPAASPRVQSVDVNPLTPSTRRNEREDIASPISLGKDDSEPDSILHTPLNAVSKKGKERAVAKEKSIPKVELATSTLETPAPCQKANPRRRNAKDVPVAVAPSRRLSLRTGFTAKPRKNASRGRTREEGGGVSPAEPLLRTTRQKSRVKKTVKPTSSSVNTDAKDRQARLDYFKKLEDYQLEKENVYVI